MSWDVFIAYPTQERSHADALYDALGGSGVFLDHRSIVEGEIWPAALKRAVQCSAMVVALVSARTENAFYQLDELAYAIALTRAKPQQHRLVPIYLDEASRLDPPYGLRIVQGIWAGPTPDWAHIAARIRAALAAPQEQQASEAAPLGSPKPVVDPPRRSPFRPGMPFHVRDRLPSPSRQDLVSDIADRVLEQDQNVNLVAPKRMGRTSLLNHVGGALVGDGRRTVAHVDMQRHIRDEQAFYGELLRSVLDQPAGRQVGEAGRRVALRDGEGATFAEVWAALDVVRREAPAVIVIDELEVMFSHREGFRQPDFSDNLSSLITGDAAGGLARFVVATQQPLGSYYEAGQITSALPRYFPLRRMGALTAGDVADVLGEHMFPDELRAAVELLAGDHPCLLQVAAQAAFDASRSGRDLAWFRQEFDDQHRQLCPGAR